MKLLLEASALLVFDSWELTIKDVKLSETSELLKNR